jgi:hypothetical protein
MGEAGFYAKATGSKGNGENFRFQTSNFGKLLQMPPYQQSFSILDV